MATTLSFDFQKLYDAVVAKKERRRLSWKAVEKEMGVSAATIKNLTKDTGKEADCVFYMLQWIGANTVSFLSGVPTMPSLPDQVETLLRARSELSSEDVDALVGVVRAPYERLRTETPVRHADDELTVEPHEVLGYKRVDSGAIYRVLDAQREARGLSWQEVADQIDDTMVTPGSIKSHARACRTGVPKIINMVSWAGLPVEVFLRFLVPPEIRNEYTLPPADLKKQIGTLLRSRVDLVGQDIVEIAQAFGTEYERVKDTSQQFRLV